MLIGIGIGLFVVGVIAGFVFGAWSMLEMVDREVQKAFGGSAKVLLRKAFQKNESKDNLDPLEQAPDRVHHLGTR